MAKRQSRRIRKVFDQEQRELEMAGITGGLAANELGPINVSEAIADLPPASKETQAILDKIDENIALTAVENAIRNAAGTPYTKPPCDLLGRVVDRSMSVIEGGKGARRVTFFRDHILDYPEMHLEIFIAGTPSEERQFAQLFARSACRKAKSVLEADLVVFTGGADVDPALYGAKPHPLTEHSPARDKHDIDLYLMCVEEGIPMFGVCRGAQFLNVMQGGKLYQHVNNHNGDHSMWDMRSKTRIQRISSVHHQMVVPNKEGGMEIIGVSHSATERWLDPDTNENKRKMDVEAFFYRDACIIGVQGHPEYTGYNHYAKWCLELINECVVLNPDIEWVDKNRRINTELLSSRKARLKESIMTFAKPAKINLEVQ